MMKKTTFGAAAAGFAWGILRRPSCRTRLSQLGGPGRLSVGRNAMFGIVWIVAVALWPSWRTWLLGLGGYVLGSFALHAFIVLRPEYSWPVDWVHWFRWIGRQASHFLIAGAIAGLIVWVRRRKGQS
jgi:hypothetical protein